MRSLRLLRQTGRNGFGSRPKPAAPANDAVVVDIPAKVQQARAGFLLAKARRQVLATIAGSREEAQASKVGAVTRRIEAVIRRTGRAVPVRTRLSANKANKTLPVKTKLSANKPRKTKRIRGSRALLSARTPTNKVPTTGSRVVRIMGRTRNRAVRIMGRTRNRAVRIMGRMRSRIARILQTTTDLPDPAVPGLAVVRLVIGAVTTLGRRPLPEPG
jgi:hypothetical protein